MNERIVAAIAPGIASGGMNVADRHHDHHRPQQPSGRPIFWSTAPRQ